MARILNKKGHKAEELHSNRTQSQRLRALQNFKKGKSRVMVATDVAARGIDVKAIELVVNYDLPDKNDDYVHRIGRTGRAGHEGHAVTFAEPGQYRDMLAIERLVGVEIPIYEATGTLTAEEVQELSQKSSRSATRSGGGMRKGRTRGGQSRGHRRGGRVKTRRPSGNGGRSFSSRKPKSGSGARKSTGGGYRGKRKNTGRRRPARAK